MEIFLPPLFLLAGAILLLILCVIDLRARLLPDIYVFPLGLLGIFYHFLHNFEILSPMDMLLGGLAGGGLLLLIRFISNHIYKQDTLGLGDVKLMAAAGLWLGIGTIFIALTLGAFAGVLHGLIVALFDKIIKKKKVSLHTLSIPAGPGFIIGIIITFVYNFLWT